MAVTYLYAVVKDGVDHVGRDFPRAKADRLKQRHRQSVMVAFHLAVYRHRRVASRLQDADGRDDLPRQPL